MKIFVLILTVGMLAAVTGCEGKKTVAKPSVDTNQQEQTAAVVSATQPSSPSPALQPAKSAPVMIKVAGSTNRVPMVP
jgi:hypothetical protein